MLSFLYSPTLTSIHDHWKNHITSIMLKERNQTRVHTKGCHLYKILENANHSDKKQINDCQYKGTGGDRREEVDFGKLRGDGYVHYLDCGDSLLGCVTIYQLVHFRHMQFIVSRVCMLSHSPVQLFVTPWTTACQAPLLVGFSR